jgi:D-alanine-D-alanine ligase
MAMTVGTVAVTFGGPSPEHDISILTGLQCERLLRRAGLEVHPLYVDRSGGWHLTPANCEARDFLSGPPSASVDLTLRASSGPGWYRKKGLRTEAIDVDVVLNCFHGAFGEGGGAQALFALMGVPATGGTIGGAALGLDKYAFGGVMHHAGIPSLQRELLLPDTEPSFPPPYIVKPRFGGSSIGIHVVEDLAAARALLATSPHLRQGAVVEPFEAGAADLNIAYRTHPAFSTSLLERPLRASAETGAIYSYEDKYLGGTGLESAPRELPANVSPEVADEAERLARRVADVTGLPGIVRVDLLLVGDRLVVNEVNSIPGAMALYLWPKDISSESLLIDMLEEALAAPPVTGAAGYSEGSALRVAGGIAGKLSGGGR